MELQTRTCLCGCALTFRVWPSSGTMYAMKSHEPDSPEKRDIRRRGVLNWRKNKKVAPGILDEEEWLDECRKADEEIEGELNEERKEITTISGPHTRKLHHYSRETKTAIEAVIRDFYATNADVKGSSEPCLTLILKTVGFKPGEREFRLKDLYQIKHTMGMGRKNKKKASDVVNTFAETASESTQRLILSAHNREMVNRVTKSMEGEFDFDDERDVDVISAIRMTIATRGLSDRKKLKLIEIYVGEEEE